MNDSDGVSHNPKILNINVKVADLREVQEALYAARKALRMYDQECRFHGTNWVMSRWNSEVPQCESCRKPYFTVQALEKLKEVLG